MPELFYGIRNVCFILSDFKLTEVDHQSRDPERDYLLLSLALRFSGRPAILARGSKRKITSAYVESEGYRGGGSRPIPLTYLKLETWKNFELSFNII